MCELAGRGPLDVPDGWRTQLNLKPRTATLLPTNIGDITEAILRYVLRPMVVTLACSGSRNTHRANVSWYASAANSSANVGLKYIEITPRPFYEAKQQF